jgi:hypothetical protein
LNPSATAPSATGLSATGLSAATEFVDAAKVLAAMRP